MFIKLTRFDNRPVWLNAAFVVTVEPRRDGAGSVVVPIGDGLDYDVRESPEEVLKMLDGTPAPKVVPVPVSDCLTKTPADVSPEPEKPEPSEKDAEIKKGDEPVKNTVRKPSRKTAAEKKPPRAAKKTAAASAKVPAKLELSDDQVERLKKMAPKSLAKIKNTLATQFRVDDVSATVAALAEKGVCRIDGNHVAWPA